MKNYQKISQVFLQFSNGSSLLNFDFLKKIENLAIFCSKKLFDNIKILYTLIISFLLFPASCVIQEMDKYDLINQIFFSLFYG